MGKGMVFTRGPSIKQCEIEIEMINSFSRGEIGKKIQSKEKNYKVRKKIESL